MGITVVPVSVVKGLELDGVVVVEPAGIVAGEQQGLRALYVALTRSTQAPDDRARAAAARRDAEIDSEPVSAEVGVDQGVEVAGRPCRRRPGRLNGRRPNGSGASTNFEVR